MLSPLVLAVASSVALSPALAAAGVVGQLNGPRYTNTTRSGCPGVLTKEDLESAGTKVAILAARYGGFRRGVVPHEYRIDERTVDDLASMDFVFLALTDGSAKKVIVNTLEESGVSFIDCGMGLYKVDDALAGQLRVTTSTPRHRAEARRHITFSDGEQDEYSQNIQIAELNSPNAIMAAMSRKQISGLYLDMEHQYNSAYVVDGNAMINDAGDRDAHHDQP